MPFVNQSQIQAFADYNYTYLYPNGTTYTNGTISNATSCYMLRDPFLPSIYPNGTVYNGTSCTSPINPIKSHGISGITFAALFVLLIPFCIASLRRHGKRAYSAKNRIYPYGKRWEFYWQLMTIAFLLISSFFSIDIDRAVVQGGSTGAFCLFWAASLPIAQASVWELSRNWGQIENDRYRENHPEMSLEQHERRVTTKFGFWMPLLFYAMDFIALFLSALTSWGDVYRGNQSAATSPRFKAGALFSVLAYLVNIWIIVNAIYAYRPNLRRLHFYTVLFSMSIILVRIVYTNYMMYHYDYSAYNPRVDVRYTVILGYLPLLLLFISHNYRGLKMENVDKKMLMARIEREKEWQAQFKKTTDGSTISSGGLLRSDISADWVTKAPRHNEHELKHFNYIVEQRSK